MRKTISIIGAIGNFRYKGKEVNGVQLVDVIAKIESLPAETKELVIEVGGHGGSVPVAKAIRARIKSIEPRIKVITKQVDDLFSAHTFIFTAASHRLAAKGINPNTGKPFQMMVHAPWITELSGNADGLQEASDSLRLSEDDMAAMYQEDIGISRESIAPLMKAESFFSTQQAIDLKFATETYEALDQAAYKETQIKKIETPQMKNKKSAIDKILAALGIAVAAAPPADLMGKPVLVNGVAAVDGVYTVVGGVVTALEAVEEEAAEDATTAAPAAASKGDAKLDEVLAALKDQPKSTDILAAVKKMIDDNNLEIKKQIKSTHTPIGYDPSTQADDSKEYDRTRAANMHVAMKKDNPELYKKLYFAKYGVVPNV